MKHIIFSMILATSLYSSEKPPVSFIKNGAKYIPREDLEPAMEKRIQELRELEAAWACIAVKIAQININISVVDKSDVEKNKLLQKQKSEEKSRQRARTKASYVIQEAMRDLYGESKSLYSLASFEAFMHSKGFKVYPAPKGYAKYTSHFNYNPKTPDFIPTEAVHKK